jgi:phosphatidylserine/phosphatidylglycerophosphate/cardiolipin synthase-like enzyme
VSVLRRLPTEMRRNLVVALDAGRVAPPYSPLSLRRAVGASLAEPVAAELERLANLGLTPRALREVLLMFDGGNERASATLVWSGPEEGSPLSRDTGVVVRELFQRARSTVLVAGFAVHQGRSIFKVLADRLDASPDLEVKMFLNVERPRGEERSPTELVVAFAERFRNDMWPGKRLPHVFHDPRAAAVLVPGGKRASLHAKCIVVDDETAFVTSANFTEAAQARNIEVGILVEEPAVAASLRIQFERLVVSGALCRVAGI